MRCENRTSGVEAGVRSVVRSRGWRGWAVRRAGRAVLRASGIARRASALTAAVVASLAAIYPAYGGGKSGADSGNANLTVTGVARGKATFSTVGNTTTITAANRTVINYTRFDIDPGQTVRFVQPGREARVLNRIDSRNPSRLDGRLEANGTVYFVNRAGVIFGPDSVLDVGRLVAAAGDITDHDFAIGIDRFTLTGAVTNAGRISAAGDVALLGARVTNSGVVASQGGAVTFAAGDGVYLGTRFGNVVVKVEQRAVPSTDATAIENTGEARAPKGGITIAAGDFYSAAFRNTGRLSARTVKIAGGKGGAVSLSGAVDARSDTGTGGIIEVTGKHIDVTSATLDASGATGGGTVLVGGGLMGGGDLYHAATVSVSSDSVLRADATAQGDGGTVVVWSDRLTLAYGTFSAVGAGVGGDGGIVETSSVGKLTLGEIVPTARAGVGGGAGTWLIDPYNVTFVNGAGGSLATPTADDTLIGIDLVKAALEGGSNVTLSTSNPAGTQSGSITLPENVNLNVSLTNPVTLSLHAASVITLLGDITATGTVAATGLPARLGLVLTAGTPAGGGTESGAGVSTAVQLAGQVRTNGGAVGVEVARKTGGNASFQMSFINDPDAGIRTEGGNVMIRAIGPASLLLPVDVGAGTLAIESHSLAQAVVGADVTAGSVALIRTNDGGTTISGTMSLEAPGNRIGTVAGLVLASQPGSAVRVVSSTPLTVGAVGVQLPVSGGSVQGITTLATNGLSGLSVVAAVSAPAIEVASAIQAPTGAVRLSADQSVTLSGGISAARVGIRSPVVTQSVTAGGIVTDQLALVADTGAGATRARFDLRSTSNAFNRLGADAYLDAASTDSYVGVVNTGDLSLASVTVGLGGDAITAEGVTVNRPLAGPVNNAVDLRTSGSLGIAAPILVLNSGNVRIEGPGGVGLSADVSLPGSGVASRALQVVTSGDLVASGGRVEANALVVRAHGDSPLVQAVFSGAATPTVAVELEAQAFLGTPAVRIESDVPLAVGGVALDGVTVSGIRVAKTVAGGTLGVAQVEFTAPRVNINAPVVLSGVEIDELQVRATSHLTVGASGALAAPNVIVDVAQGTVALAGPIDTGRLAVLARGLMQTGSSVTATGVALVSSDPAPLSGWTLTSSANAINTLAARVRTTPGSPLTVNSAIALSVGDVDAGYVGGLSSSVVSGVSVSGADGGLGFAVSTPSLTVASAIDLRSAAPTPATTDLSLLGAGAITLGADVFARDVAIPAVTLSQTAGAIRARGLLITGSTTGSVEIGGANSFSRLAADVTVGPTGRLWVNSDALLSVASVSVGSVSVSGLTVAGGTANAVSMRVSGAGDLTVDSAVKALVGRIELVRGGSLTLSAPVTAPGQVSLQASGISGGGAVNTDLLALVAGGPGAVRVSGEFHRVAASGVAGSSFDLTSTSNVATAGAFVTLTGAGGGVSLGGISTQADPSASVPAFALAAPSITIAAPVVSSGSVLLKTVPKQVIVGEFMGGSITLNASVGAAKLALVAVDVTQPAGAVTVGDLYLLGLDLPVQPSRFDLSAPFSLVDRPGPSGISPAGYNTVTNLAADLALLNNSDSTLKLRNQASSPLNVTTVSFPGLGPLSGIDIGGAVGSAAYDAVVLTGGALNILQPITSMVSGDVVLDRSGPVTLSAAIRLTGGSTSRKLAVRAAGVSQSALGSITAPSLALLGTAEPSATYSLDADNTVSTFAADVTVNPGGGLSIHTPLSDLAISQLNAFGGNVSGVRVSGTSAGNLAFRSTGRRLSVNRTVTAAAGDVVLDHTGTVSTSLLLETGISAPGGLLAVRSTGTLLFNLDVDRLTLIGTDPNGSYSVFNSSIHTLAATFPSGGTGDLFVGADPDPADHRSMTVGVVAVPHLSLTLDGISTGGVRGAFPTVLLAGYQLTLDAPMSSSGDISLNVPSDLAINASITTPGTLDLSQFLTSATYTQTAGSLDVGALVLYGSTDFDGNPQSVSATLASSDNNIRTLAVDYAGRSIVSIANGSTATASIGTVVSLGNTLTGIDLRSGGTFAFSGGTLSVAAPIAVSESTSDTTSLVSLDVSTLTLADDLSVGGLLRLSVNSGTQTAGRIDTGSLAFHVSGTDVFGGSLLLDRPGNVVPLLAGRAVNASFSLTTTDSPAGNTVLSTVDGITGIAADQPGFTPKFLRLIGPDLTVGTILNAGFNALILDRSGSVLTSPFPTAGLQVTSFAQTSIRAASVELPSVFAQNLTLLSAPGTSGDFRLGSPGTASNVPAFVAHVSLATTGSLALTTPEFPNTLLASLTSPFGTHSGATLSGSALGQIAFSHTGAGFTVEPAATLSVPASTDIRLDEIGPVVNQGAILAPGGLLSARIVLPDSSGGGALPVGKGIAPVAFATTPGSRLITDRLLLVGHGHFILDNSYLPAPIRPGVSVTPATSNSVSRLAADITDGVLLLTSDTPVSTASLSSPLGAASGVTLSTKAPVLRGPALVPPSVPVFTLTSPGFSVTTGNPVSVLNVQGDGVVSLDQSGPISLLAPVSTGTLTARGTFASFTQSAAGAISSDELGVVRTGPGSVDVNLSTATNNVSAVGATLTGNFRLRTASDLTVAAFAPRFSLDQSLTFTGVNVSPTGLVDLDAGGRLDALGDVLGSSTALGSRGVGVFGPAVGPGITVAGNVISLAALRQSTDPALRGRVTQLQNVVFRGASLGSTSPNDFRIRQAFQIDNLPLVFGSSQLAANFFLLESTQGFVNVGANSSVTRSNLTLIGNQGVILSAPMLLNSLSIPSGSFVRFDSFAGGLPSVTTAAFRDDTPLAGSQFYAAPAILNRDTTTLAAANHITFQSTINCQGGPRALVVAAQQTAAFNGAVGLSSPLLSLTSTVPALTLLNADVGTTTFQTFGRTTASGVRTLTTGSTVSFLAFIDDAPVSPARLTVSGNAAFTALDLADLTVTGNALGDTAFVDDSVVVSGTADFTGVTARTGSISAGLARITTATAQLDINAGNAAIGTATAGRDITVFFGGAVQHITSARDVSFGVTSAPAPFTPNASITPIPDAFVGRIDTSASVFALNNLTLGPANVTGRTLVGQNLTLIGSLASGTVFVSADTTGPAHNITTTGSQTYLGQLTVASVTAHGAVSVGKSATLLSLKTTGTGPVEVGTNLQVGSADISGTLFVGNDLTLTTGLVTGDVTVGRDATGTHLASGGNIAVTGTAAFTGLTASNNFSADLALIDHLIAASVNAGAVVIGTAAITGDVVVARSGSVQALTADDVSFGTNALIGSGVLSGTLSVGNDLTFTTLSFGKQFTVGRDASGVLLVGGAGVSVGRTATMTDATATGAFIAGTTVVSGTLAAASLSTGTADIGTATLTGDITVTGNADLDHVASALDLTVGGNLTALLVTSARDITVTGNADLDHVASALDLTVGGNFTSTLITSARDIRVTGNALLGSVTAAGDVGAGGHLVALVITSARDLSAGTDALLGTVVFARSIVTGRDLTLTSGTFSGAATVGRDLTADFLAVAGATTVIGLADIDTLTGGSLAAGTADITLANLTLDVSVTGLARFGTLSARNANFGASALLGTLALTGDLTVAQTLVLGTGNIAGSASILGNAAAVDLASGPLSVGSGPADGTLTVTGTLAAASLTANAAELTTAAVTNDARVFGPLTAESFTTTLGSLHAGSADVTTATIVLDLTLDASGTFTTLTVGRDLTTGLDLTALSVTVTGPASVGRTLLVGGPYSGSSLVVGGNASISSLTLSSDLTVSGLTSITTLHTARDLTLTGPASIDTLTLSRNLDAGAGLLLGSATLTGAVTVASNAVVGSLTAGSASVGFDLTADVLAITDTLFVGRDLKVGAATIGSDATVGRDLNALTVGSGGAVEVGNTAAISGTLTAASLAASAADLGTLALTGDADITLDGLVRRITSADEIRVGRDAFLGPVSGTRALSTGRHLTAAADLALTGGDLTVGGDATLRNVSAVNNLAVVGNLLLVNGSFSRSGTGTFSVGGTSTVGDNDTALAFGFVIFSGPASFGIGAATLSAPDGITFKSALTTAGTAFDLTSVSGPIVFEGPVSATGPVAWNLKGGTVALLNPATFAAGTVQITGKSGITFTPAATLRGSGTSFSLLLTDVGNVRIDGDVFAARSSAGTGGDFSIVIPAPDRNITATDNVTSRVLLGGNRNQIIEVGGTLTFDFPTPPTPGLAPVTPFSPTLVVSPDVTDPAAPLPTVSISAADIDSASFHRLVALGNLSLTARDDTQGALNNLITFSDVTVRGQLTLSADQTRILRRQRGPVLVPAPTATDPLAFALDTVSDTGSAVIAARYSVTRGAVVSFDRDGLTDTGGRLSVAAPASQAGTVPAGNSLLGFALSADTLEPNASARLQVLRLDQLRLGSGPASLFFDLPLKGNPLDFGNLASEFVELLPGVNTPDALPAGSGGPNGFTADQIRRLEIALGLRLGGGAEGGLTPDQLADALTNGYRIFGSDLLTNPIPATDTQLGGAGGPAYAVNAEQAVVLLTFLDELLPPSPENPAAPATEASASTDALASALSAYLASLAPGASPDGAGLLAHTFATGTPEQTAALTSLRRMLAGIDLLGLPDSAASDARSNFLKLLTDRLPESSHPGLTKDQVLQLLLSLPSSPDIQTSTPTTSARASLK